MTRERALESAAATGGVPDPLVDCGPKAGTPRPSPMGLSVYRKIGKAVAGNGARTRTVNSNAGPECCREACDRAGLPVDGVLNQGAVACALVEECK